MMLLSIASGPVQVPAGSFVCEYYLNCYLSASTGPGKREMCTQVQGTYIYIFLSKAFSLESDLKYYVRMALASHGHP